MQSFAEALGAPTQAAPDQSMGMGEALGPQSTPEGTPASPEQQEQYNQFVAMGLQMIWGEQARPQIAEMLKSAPGKIEAMAQVGSMVVTRLYMSAKEQGIDVDTGVLLYGGIELMGEIHEFATQVIGEISDEQFENAVYLGADMVRDMLEQQGLVDPASQEADLAEFEAAMGSGEVDALVERVTAAKQSEMDAMMGNKQGAAQ